MTNWSSRRACSPTHPTAFVLSGGSVFGAVQVGQLRALLEADIVPDLLVGCSVGALNAIFLASHPDLNGVRELEDIWLSLRSRDIFDFRSRQNLAGLVRGSDHLCRPDGLQDLITRFCPVGDLSETAVRLEVVTTDLERARPCWWSTGPAQQVLLASAALPGIFPPVLLDGSRHVDGGVLVPVPTGRAFELGAADVYVCDVSSRTRPQLPCHLGALSTLLEAFNVARFAHGGEPHEGVTVLPTPDLDGLSMLDFTHTEKLIRTAYQMTVDALEQSGNLLVLSAAG